MFDELKRKWSKIVITKLISLHSFHRTHSLDLNNIETNVTQEENRIEKKQMLCIRGGKEWFY